jgi:hypothetical protein
MRKSQSITKRKLAGLVKNVEKVSTMNRIVMTKAIPEIGR